MRSASAKNRRTARAVLAGAFLLAGVFGLLGLAQAAEKDEKEPKKEPAKPKAVVVTPTGPMTLKMSIHKDAPADVGKFNKNMPGKLQRELAEAGPVSDKRQLGAQDLAWALLNTKEFLFNH